MNAEDLQSGKSERLLRNELLISQVLRFGVILCGAVIGLGLIGRLGGWGAGSTSGVIHTLLDGQRIAGYRPPAAPAPLLHGLFHLDPDTWMATGLILLISLPILRVGLTVVLFLLEGDFVFFGLTLAVFSVLLLSILLGRVV
jgi:uncharacterized membrane protein